MRAGEPRSTSVKKHRWQFHDHLLEIFHMGSTFKTSFMCCLHSRQSVLVTRLQETSSKALSQDSSTQRQSLSQVRSGDIFLLSLMSQVMEVFSLTLVSVTPPGLACSVSGLDRVQLALSPFLSPRATKLN